MLTLLIARVKHKVHGYLTIASTLLRWLSSARLKLSQLISHVTPYKLECSHCIGGKSICQKNPVQDLLSSLNAVISTNERS